VTRGEKAAAAGLISLVTILTYGVLISRLGFYRDDWYLLSTAQSQGPAGIVALFQIDRPLIGYFYAIAYRLLGAVPLAWQVLALLMRLAGNLSFFWLLRQLWPERKTETVVVALLFSIYPGYTVQPNAGVYVTDLVTSAAALFSFCLMLKAIQSPRRLVWLLLSILAGVLELIYLGFFESAIGLEVGRLALVWYFVWRQRGAAFKSSFLDALKADSIYLLLGWAFLVWRLFLFQSSRRATNLSVLVGRYSALPVRSALAILVETVKDVIETTILAWAVPFYQSIAMAAYRDLAIGVVLALVVAACVLLFLRRASAGSSPADANSPRYQHLHLVWLGGLIVVFALLPIDMAGRNVLFSDQWDRYTIYASAGVALFVGGMTFHFFDGAARKVALLTLIGTAVVVHYFSAAWYRDFWSGERDLWQQIVWRAPAIQRGTMLFVSPPFAGFQEGYEIYGPANMIYYRGESLQLGGDVLNADTAANLQLQKNRQHYDRSVLVDDNYRTALMAVYPTPHSCLHVLDGRRIELPGLVDDSLVADVATYSDINLIETSAQPAVLPNFLAGAKPPTWCRYYQQMDLARQQGNWQEVARLADEAQARGFTPEDVSEWMPALDAYATLGRMPEARHAASIIRSVDAARAFLCLQMQRGAVYPPPYDYNLVNQSLCQAN
jgi:hypothetical protein